MFGLIPLVKRRLSLQYFRGLRLVKGLQRSLALVAM